MKTKKTVMHTNIKLLIKSIIITLICLHNVSTYSQNFNNPESIVYDADRDRYIVSNKTGGYLSEINSDWEVSLMCKGCSSAKGLYIEGEKLYVATNKKVLIIDLNTDKIISSISIKEAQFLNDISSDKKGKIWVSDTFANKVFEIDTKTQHQKP
jgi:DNA-binding beta-propeller fold protein YncE